MKTTTALAVLALTLATPVTAAEITVLCTGGARAVMTSLVPEYERISGDKVTISFATPGEMRDKLVNGEAADVAVGIAAIMPDLETVGRLVYPPPNDANFKKRVTEVCKPGYKWGGLKMLG